MKHLLYGSIGATVFCWAILHFDMGGIGTLIGRSESPQLWQFMLFFGNWVTFGGVAMAVAIMQLGEDVDNGANHPSDAPPD
ncbi:MAG: hypothetical protein HOH04_02715 [Rhodospirillaceae bacterium]|nr:hypothetical protein [Rhodospirillaceae bacterium]